MSDQPQSTPAPASSREALKGFGIGVGLIIVGTCLLARIGMFLARHFQVFELSIWLVFGFGVTQLIYMVPAILIARRRGRTGLAKGQIIAASLAFLLNASCFVLFWSGKMGRIGG
jgi:hypothetical protein